MQPVYIVEESKLRRNGELIAGVARRAGVEIILAFKAYALWKTFPVLRDYVSSTTASSLNEARLAVEEFGHRAHTYSPAYTDEEFDQIVACSSHLTFNSLSQYRRLHDRVGEQTSIGLRVNPEYSEVGTLLYNPCAPGTRFGVTADKLPDKLPPDIEGFHCHCHCESGADVLQRTLTHIEAKFARWFSQLKWLNLGGGHLMTRRDYDLELLVSILQGLHARYPWLHIILEPGSAFGWETGYLKAHVVDIVEDRGIRTAILDVSFTCHMPDCLEMPYFPTVRGAEHVEEPRHTTSPTEPAGCSPATTTPASLPHVYRLGGNSCLSGDYMSSWRFDHELQSGEEIIFEDMAHYTTVKTTMFNGIGHPALALLRADGTLQQLRQFTYEDYRDRMD